MSSREGGGQGEGQQGGARAWFAVEEGEFAEGDALWPEPGEGVRNQLAERCCRIRSGRWGRGDGGLRGSGRGGTGGGWQKGGRGVERMEAREGRGEEVVEAMEGGQALGDGVVLAGLSLSEDGRMHAGGFLSVAVKRMRDDR